MYNNALALETKIHFSSSSSCFILRMYLFTYKNYTVIIFQRFFETKSCFSSKKISYYQYLLRAFTSFFGLIWIDKYLSHHLNISLNITHCIFDNLDNMNFFLFSQTFWFHEPCQTLNFARIFRILMSTHVSSHKPPTQNIQKYLFLIFFFFLLARYSFYLSMLCLWNYYAISTLHSNSKCQIAKG